MIRPATNTEALQKHHPDIYRGFFAASERVASASHSFLWMGEFAGFYGGLTVCQKLPLRAYVGLETTFDRAITIDQEYQTYAGDQGRFVARAVDEPVRENLTTYLEKHFAGDQHFTGLKVHLLTEVPLGHSMGSNGAISAALAMLISPDQKFEAVFKVARELLSLSQSGNSSGVSAYTALSESTAPIVFFSHGQKYTAKPLTELISPQNEPVWHLDFGLIYTGTETTAESVILANTHTIHELDQKGQTLHSLLKNSPSLNFKETYINMLNMTTGLLISAMTDLLSKGAQKTVQESLFNSMNQYQNLLHILDVTTGTTDLIYAKVHALANKQRNDVGSGVKISGLGKGGVMLFAVPYGTHRNDLLELIEKLQRETGSNIWLDYASWLDGVGGEAGIIEQDLKAGKTSAFISRDAFSLLTLHQGVPHRSMVTQERFSDYVKQIDLLLDKTTDKISIGGKSVTSKQLPSQKATVAIMADLIQAPQFTLGNHNLPSSYGVNRYDLQGKITLPLIKHIKKATGRDLQLSIQGQMYDNYSLTLNPSNIVIGLIEKKI